MKNENKCGGCEEHFAGEVRGGPYLLWLLGGCQVQSCADELPAFSCLQAITPALAGCSSAVPRWGWGLLGHWAPTLSSTHTPNWDTHYRKGELVVSSVIVIGLWHGEKLTFHISFKISLLFSLNPIIHSIFIRWHSSLRKSISFPLIYLFIHL